MVGRNNFVIFLECAVDASEIQRRNPVGTLALSSRILLKKKEFFPDGVGFLNHQLWVMYQKDTWVFLSLEV